MEILSQIRNGGMGNGKRLCDGEIRLTYPLTAIDTRLLLYPFTTLMRNKKETNLRGA